MPTISSSSDPKLRVVGEAHPVPLIFGSFFTFLALGGLAIAFFADALVAGLVFGGLFAIAGALFWLECIPPWIELDDEGLRFRKKLLVRRVLWREVAALGRGIPSEINPGSLLVRLNPDACRAHGMARPEAMYHYDVPALETFKQDELLEHARARWQNAGGEGTMFDVWGELRRAGRELREGAHMLLELERQAHPEAARAFDLVRAEERAPGVVALAAPYTDGTRPVAPDDIYCSVMHVRGEGGDLFFCVVAGGKDLEALASTVRRVVERLVGEHRFNPEFGGRLEVSLVPDLTPKTAALAARMDALVAELERAFERARVVATRARPIRIAWAHGHPARAEAEPSPS